MENSRGSAYMILAMAFFALEDMFIKAASSSVPAGEILIFFGIGGSIAFMLMTLKRGEAILHPAILTRAVLIRALSEIIGRLGFTLALVLTPLSSTSAILQATPLVVVMGAAIFFGEKVGWRRWSAILIGFIGVLMIIRPGLEGFQANSLLAVVGMLGFAGRDLATRAAPKVLSNVQLGVYGFLVLIPTGIGLLLYSGGAVIPDLLASGQILGAIVFGVIAYYALTLAMRTGEISVVTPFRYTRLVFALLLGFLVFGERPDAMTLLGSAIIVAGGIYTLLRNRQVRQATLNANT
ncbi:DMT family transporter [Leucothrix pacifica]|uniref:EamA family transporter n=1 Tax=Leucothrix pacifica TaxID=1247513 RepID=A0A317CQT5_9GAMM|nr:DMT family transporter [Leucothrix pacifica]PWQ99893.1 EamA family transporter [Leucothrix pacifica]